MVHKVWKLLQSLTHLFKPLQTSFHTIKHNLRKWIQRIQWCHHRLALLLTKVQGCPIKDKRLFKYHTKYTCILLQFFWIWAGLINRLPGCGLLVIPLSSTGWLLWIRLLLCRHLNLTRVSDLSMCFVYKSKVIFIWQDFLWSCNDFIAQRFWCYKKIISKLAYESIKNFKI